MGCAVSLLSRNGNRGTAFHSVSTIKKIEGKSPQKKLRTNADYYQL